MRVKRRKSKPSGKKREKARSTKLNLLPYLTAATLVKTVLECVKLLIGLLRSR